MQEKIKEVNKDFETIRDIKTIVESFNNISKAVESSEIQNIQKIINIIMMMMMMMMMMKTTVINGNERLSLSFFIITNSTISNNYRLISLLDRVL